MSLVVSDASKVKYHCTFDTLLALSQVLQKTGWQTSLHSLNDEDIHLMTKGTEGRSSEGRRCLSWIWLVFGDGNSEGNVEGDADEQLQEGMLCNTKYIV